MTAREVYLQMSAQLSDQPPLSKQMKSLMNDYLTPSITKYIINSQSRQKV